MNLRYIALYMDDDSGYSLIENKFNYNTSFINNFLSSKVRNLKFKTDGTYDMIAVTPSLDIKHAYKIVGDNALQARIKFDESAYKSMSELQRYEYFLYLLEEGYKTCKKRHAIPHNELIEFHNELRKNGFKNEWIHKKKRFASIGFEVVLRCSFTAFDFKLTISINDLRNLEELVTGVVIRTLPNEVHFDSLFKDIIVKNNELLITEYQNRPKFKFSLKDIRNNKFSFKVLEAGLKYSPYRGRPSLK